MNTNKIEEQIEISQQNDVDAIKQIKEELIGQLDGIKARQDKVGADIENIKSGKISIPSVQGVTPELEETQAKIKQLENMIHQQEKLTKQMNIVVKNHEWTDHSLTTDANNFFKINFDFSNVIKSVTQINRERKIARVKFNNFSAKETVVSTKARVLKHTVVSINRELTKKALLCNKKLQEKAVELRNTGKVVKVSGSRMCVEEKLYTWDLNNETIRQVNISDTHSAKLQRPHRSQPNQ